MPAAPHQHDSLFLGGRKNENGGNYGPLQMTVNDDDDEEDQELPLKSSMQSLEVGDDDGHDMSCNDDNNTMDPPGWGRTLFTPVLPDDGLHLLGVQLMDSVAGVRLFKFFAFTWVGLVGMFYFVRWMDFENDTSYTIPDMIVYDGQPILMDTMFFFVVGRLYKQRGIDHLAWMATAVASGLFTSMETWFPFLQASVTLYSMHCLWPWSLWVFAISVVVLCAVVLLLHIRTLIQQQQLGMKVFEMTICVVLFLLPLISDPYFHFHHWYAGWLIGMHCNINVWWSRLTMAWCWGAYINGIAVYGRDPLLTCGYSFYLSDSSHCPYLKCYIDAMKNHTQTTYKIMEAQDWRDCSANDYLP